MKRREKDLFFCFFFFYEHYFSLSLDLEKTISLPIIVNSAALNITGTQFIVGGADCTVRVFDYGTGKELELHKGHHGPVHCVRYSPDGNTFASG